MGKETELKRKQEMQQKYLQVAREKRMKIEATQREQFRQKQKELFSIKQLEKDLFQSQKACEQLDKAKVRTLGQNVHHNYLIQVCGIYLVYLMVVSFNLIVSMLLYKSKL